MRRVLDVRAAVNADYDAFARLFRQLGVPDPTPSQEKWEREIAPRTLVAVSEGAVVGYCFVQTLRDTGYVRHLVSDASARRRGVGRTLMNAVRSRFRAEGCTRWCLNVRPDNVAALGLYRALGMEVAYPSTAMSIAWIDVPRLPDGPGRAVVDPLLDARVEARFGLPAGQLADTRTRVGYVVLTLVEGAEVVGVAAFDPSFPGAFPFRVAGPSCVRSLLTGMRPHARTEDLEVRIVIEDGAAVEDSVLAAGGTVRLRMLHLRGALG